MVVRNKRADVAKIIRDLAKTQSPSQDFVFPSISFSGGGYSIEEYKEMDDDDGLEPVNDVNKDHVQSTMAVRKMEKVSCKYYIESVFCYWM